MGRVKSKTTTKDHKKRNVMIGVFMFVLFVVIFMMASNPHPRYNQLVKNYEKGVPVEWKEIDRDNYKDFYGSCVLTVDPVECPYIKSKYVTENSASDKLVYEYLLKFLTKNGFTNEKINKKCGDVGTIENVQSNDCTVSATIGNTELLFSLTKLGVGSKIEVEVIAYEKN